MSASGLGTGRARTSSPSTSATGSTTDNQSATAREQSWHDVTAAVDAIRTRFGRAAVGSAAMVTDEGVQVPARRDAPWGPDE